MACEVWLTGFEPFGEHTVNVSQQVAEALDGFADVVGLGDSPGPYRAETRESSVVVRSTILTVDEVGSGVIASRLESENGLDIEKMEMPEAVVHLGLAENAEWIRVEEVAVNRLDFRIADNSGRQVSDAQIHRDAPARLHTTSPHNLVLAECAGDDRIRRSDDAGEFVCNETYFRTLHSVETNRLKDKFQRALPVIFVHLPPTSAISLDDQIELVRRIIALVVQRPSMEVVGGLLRNDENRLLAARRSPEEYMGGYWEFPGGKVEPGESKAEALAREYFEEFGWRVKPLRICEEYSHTWPEMTVQLTFFLCEPEGELPPAVMTSHDECRWLQESELMGIEWLPPDVEFVERIQEKGVANL
jgi:8-oxo-dGTP diphosphatase